MKPIPTNLEICDGSFSEQCQGLEEYFAFGGNVLTTIENTLPSSVGRDSFTISCKNSSWVSGSKCNLCLDHTEQELNDSFRSVRVRIAGKTNIKVNVVFRL